MDNAMDLISCQQCIHQDHCPAGWSYGNSACLTIQKEKKGCDQDDRSQRQIRLSKDLHGSG